MLSIALSAIAFFVSSYYLRRCLEDMGIPKGMTRGHTDLHDSAGGFLRRGAGCGPSAADQCYAGTKIAAGFVARLAIDRSQRISRGNC